MSEFAKLFNVNGEQVLVTSDYDDSDNESPFKLRQRADIDGITCTAAPCYAAEEDVDEAFKNYTQEQAEKYLAWAKKMVKGEIDLGI